MLNHSTVASLFYTQRSVAVCLLGVEMLQLILLLHLKAIMLWATWQWCCNPHKACWISNLVCLSELSVFCSGWGVCAHVDMWMFTFIFSAELFLHAVCPCSCSVAGWFFCISFVFLERHLYRRWNNAESVDMYYTYFKKPMITQHSDYTTVCSTSL